MNCKNCNAQLHPNSDYCHVCGAKVIRNRLTLKNLFEHLSETFFNYDNKLFRTIIDLFRKPEEVIGGYISGVRKRYVNPISFFGLALTLSGLLLFLINKFYLEYYFDSFNAFSQNSSENNHILEKTMQPIAEFSLEYSSIIFSFLIPIAALISVIVFFNKKYNYTEHLVVYLYTLSLYSLFSSIIGLGLLLTYPQYYMYLGQYIILVFFIYHLYALKRLFQLSVIQLVLKTLFFLVLGFVFYIGFSILMAIAFFVTGVFNIEDFKPPTTQY